MCVLTLLFWSFMAVTFFLSFSVLCFHFLPPSLISSLSLGRFCEVTHFIFAMIWFLFSYLCSWVLPPNASSSSSACSFFPQVMHFWTVVFPLRVNCSSVFCICFVGVGVFKGKQLGEKCIATWQVSLCCQIFCIYFLSIFTSLSNGLDFLTSYLWEFLRVMGAGEKLVRQSSNPRLKDERLPGFCCHKNKLFPSNPTWEPVCTLPSLVPDSNQVQKQFHHHPCSSHCPNLLLLHQLQNLSFQGDPLTFKKHV